MPISTINGSWVDAAENPIHQQKFTFLECLRFEWDSYRYSFPIENPVKIMLNCMGSFGSAKEWTYHCLTIFKVTGLLSLSQLNL